MRVSHSDTDYYTFSEYNRVNGGVNGGPRTTTCKSGSTAVGNPAFLIPLIIQQVGRTEIRSISNRWTANLHFFVVFDILADLDPENTTALAPDPTNLDHSTSQKACTWLVH